MFQNGNKTPSSGPKMAANGNKMAANGNGAKPAPKFPNSAAQYYHETRSLQRPRGAAAAGGHFG